MAVLLWNARGVGNKETLEYIKFLKGQHRPALCVILEPKLDGDCITKIAKKLRYKHCMQQNPVNSHIWIFWDQGLDVTLVRASSQLITVRINMDDNFSVLASFVYAKCNRGERQDL